MTSTFFRELDITPASITCVHDESPLLLDSLAALIRGHVRPGDWCELNVEFEVSRDAYVYATESCPGYQPEQRIPLRTYLRLEDDEELEIRGELAEEIWGHYQDEIREWEI